MKNIIEDFADRSTRTWSDEAIDKTKKEEVLSKPADYKGAVEHFNARHKERVRRQPFFSKNLGKVAAGAAFFGIISGGAAGLATEMSSAARQQNDRNPASWIGNSINYTVERAEDIIHPSNFDTFGHQTVIAHENDTLNNLAENVRGYGKLTSEQFQILVNNIEAANGIEKNESLPEGMEVGMPESVED